MALRVLLSTISCGQRDKGMFQTSMLIVNETIGQSQTAFAVCSRTLI
jgi:hypothetical protein